MVPTSAILLLVSSTVPHRDDWDIYSVRPPSVTFNSDEKMKKGSHVMTRTKLYYLVVVVTSQYKILYPYDIRTLKGVHSEKCPYISAGVYG